MPHLIGTKYSRRFSRWDAMDLHISAPARERRLFEPSPEQALAMREAIIDRWTSLSSFIGSVAIRASHVRIPRPNVFGNSRSTVHSETELATFDVTVVNDEPPLIAPTCVVAPASATEFAPVSPPAPTPIPTPTSIAITIPIPESARSVPDAAGEHAQFEIEEPKELDEKRPQSSKALRYAWIVFGCLLVLALFSMGNAKPASAQVAPVDPNPSVAQPNVPPAATPSTTPPTTIAGPGGPAGPTGPSGQGQAGTATLNLNLNDALNKPSQSILIIILITLLSVAPALLIMLTSFTRIVIVLTLTRNALGVMSVPPNQVLVGLALFLSLFIMSPVFSDMNKNAIQPYMAGKITQTDAYNAGVKPLKAFMLKQTRRDELALFVKASTDKKPDKPENVGMSALVPAFILSEMKTAFIIGFVVFIPFLVIDIIVSSSLMSMGMMMLPPQMISLPFKLLLFVLVDGWGLIVRSLITSFN